MTQTQSIEGYLLAGIVFAIYSALRDRKESETALGPGDRPYYGIVALAWPFFFLVSVAGWLVMKIASEIESLWKG